MRLCKLILGFKRLWTMSLKGQKCRLWNPIYTISLSFLDQYFGFIRLFQCWVDWMNSITLSDLGLSILFLSVSIRTIFIGIPVYSFSKLFSGHLREGTSLFRRLEIEGLEKFVKQELFLGISPYFALCIAIWLTQMSEVFVADLSNILLIITISAHSSILFSNITSIKVSSFWCWW